jgi:hypothetical protein
VAGGDADADDNRRKKGETFMNRTLQNKRALVTGGAAGSAPSSPWPTRCWRTGTNPPAGRSCCGWATPGEGDRILGFTALGVEAGEVMAAGLPYTVLRDLVLTHPTVAEGLGDLFSAVPSRG